MHGCTVDGLSHQLGHQRRVPWVGCLWGTTMNSNVVRPAECRRVGESEGCTPMLKSRDVVDFEETGPSAPFSLTSPTIPI